MNHDAYKLCIEALYWRRRYYDSNPEVGMGPTMERMLDAILARLEIDVAYDDRAAIVAIASHLIKTNHTQGP